VEEGALAALYRQGLSYQEVTDELDLSSAPRAHEAMLRAISARMSQPSAVGGEPLRPLGDPRLRHAQSDARRGGLAVGTGGIGRGSSPWLAIVTGGQSLAVHDRTLCLLDGR